MAKRHPHEVFTNLQVIEPVTGPVPESPVVRLQFGKEHDTVAAQFVKQAGIGRFALFHTGARKVLRRWPGERFAALGARLRERYGLDIVFTGTPDEREAIEAVRKSMDFKTYLFSGHTLPDLAALASRAALFVGNESGPMHLAAAMGIPVIGLFGPGEPHVFAPFGEKCAVVHHKLECNPCDQVHCQHPENTCMQRITVEEVVREASALLG
jgi:ADP-heptose:LPS heptosyltransferase